MEYRSFGTTDLRVSLVGFGAWAIGGPVMAGETPIGWGASDDEVSRKAIRKALELGITFFDTADFYGLGHSEILLGEELRKMKDVVVATKVGHRMGDDGGIVLDYSKKHILRACEESLRRLRRETIDHYQLHSARLLHLEQGECLDAMERLVEKGHIRTWGLSLNTFDPEPEARFLLERGLGHGLQLVLNILNRRALGVVGQAQEKGYGIIARMPLQFGLLTGAFTPDHVFAKDDHRSFRLSPEIIRRTNELLAPLWRLSDAEGATRTQAVLAFLARTPGLSTMIPGIRTPGQAETNAAGADPLPRDVGAALDAIDAGQCEAITALLQAQG